MKAELLHISDKRSWLFLFLQNNSMNNSTGVSLLCGIWVIDSRHFVLVLLETPLRSKKCKIWEACRHVRAARTPPCFYHKVTTSSLWCFNVWWTLGCVLLFTPWKRIRKNKFFGGKTWKFFVWVKPFLEAYNRGLACPLATNALQFHLPPGLRGLTVYRETNAEVCGVGQT